MRGFILMIILIQCNDRVGLVAAISRILAETGLNIISMREHVEKEGAWFFTRIEADGLTDTAILKMKFQSALPEGADVRINPMPEKKIIVLVTKEYHCLGDILLRNHFRTLGASIQCVIGNYAVLSNLCEKMEIPFFHVTHEGKTKTVFEEDIFKIVQRFAPDYLVLAKFMRILSPEFVQQFENRIINIHHSFLPAFSGAHPYRQAYERGVKLIGATSHFVTNNLDEGPIISQQIIPVTHAYTSSDMVRAGKEIETAVLARALQLVFEDKVMVYKNKTVVLE